MACSKKTVQEVIDKYLRPMACLLQLSGWAFEYYIVNSSSRVPKRWKLHKWDYTDKCAVTYIGRGNCATIVIYYNNLRSKQEAINTLWHELLHCAFRRFTDYVTIHTDKAMREEERLIGLLDPLIQGCVKLEKLIKKSR